MKLMTFVLVMLLLVLWGAGRLDVQLWRWGGWIRLLEYGPAIAYGIAVPLLQWRYPDPHRYRCILQTGQFRLFWLMPLWHEHERP